MPRFVVFWTTSTIKDEKSAAKFHYVKHWAEENKMVINIAKTKEIVFKRPKPRLYITPLPITEVQQVSSAKLLGVTLCDTLRFDVHVGNV